MRVFSPLVRKYTSSLEEIYDFNNLREALKKARYPQKNSVQYLIQLSGGLNLRIVIIIWLASKHTIIGVNLLWLNFQKSHQKAIKI